MEKLNLIDKSNYLKGLLLLIGKDHKIAPEEKKLMKRVGKSLGFEKKFIDRSINDLLENEYITDDIPIFSNQLFAESFLLDGLKFAFSDRELNPEEIEFLKVTALKNGMDETWFSSLLENYLVHFESLNERQFLFVEDYL